MWSASDLGFSMVPAPVTSLSGVRAMAGNDYVVETLKTDGTVWGFGVDENHQLGGPGGPGPVHANGFSDGIGIAVDHDATFAVKSDGTVWVWGWGYTQTPTQMPSISDATATISTSEQDTYVLASDGSVWAWGSNQFGQLGQGTTGAYTHTPAKIPGLTGVVAPGRRPGLRVRPQG